MMSNQEIIVIIMIIIKIVIKILIRNLDLLKKYFMKLIILFGRISHHI